MTYYHSVGQNENHIDSNTWLSDAVDHWLVYYNATVYLLYTGECLTYKICVHEFVCGSI